MTVTEFRRALGQEIVDALSGYQVLYMGDVRDYREVELPLVTYSIRVKVNYERGYDEFTEKDLQAYTGTVTQLIPHDVILTIGVHSLYMEEADSMYHAVLRTFGFAPLIGGIGFKLTNDSPRPAEEFGVYSYWLEYTGWVLLEGVAVTAPLVREVRHGVKVSAYVGDTKPAEESVTVTEEDL